MTMDINYLSANLLLAYTTYAIGTASPGPSNFAVMATAMNVGRKHALILALGVVTGSGIWGLLAAFGLAAIISTYSIALIFMKVVGGLYLLWLASKSAQSAMSGTTSRKTTSNGINASYRSTYLRGIAMHLTNPKAIFVWLSIVSLALPVGAKTMDALKVVLGCEVLGLIVFGGYAMLFSTSRARNIYIAIRRYFESALAIVFSYAGVRMLASIR